MYVSELLTSLSLPDDFVVVCYRTKGKKKTIREVDPACYDKAVIDSIEPFCHLSEDGNWRLSDRNTVAVFCDSSTVKKVTNRNV